MIRLTLANGENWYVNPNHIVSVKKGYETGAKVSTNHQTGIVSTIDVTHVTESPEEVARKVLEWRLAMIDYHHDIPSVKTKAMAELANLAGLEIPKGEETA